MSTLTLPVLKYQRILKSIYRFGCTIKSQSEICSVNMNQFSSVAQSCLTLCHPMNCSTPGFPVHHHFLELAQTHVHQVSDAIQPSHPLSSLSPPVFNLSQHQGLFQCVSSLPQVAKLNINIFLNQFGNLLKKYYC